MADEAPGSPTMRMPALPFAAMGTPQFVFNNFSNEWSPSEITSNLAFGSRLLVSLVMPYPTAKSFALSLLAAIESYEKATGQQVESVEVLAAKMGDDAPSDEKTGE